MKRIFLIITTILLLSTSVTAIDLFIDTEEIDTDVSPTVIEGRTLVPVRAIFESLGATVEWNSETRTATGTRGDTTITLTLGSNVAYVNGEEKSLDVPAQSIDGRTMVPARFISEALDCDVTWHQETQTAAVANTLKGQHIYSSQADSHYHYNNFCNGKTYSEINLAEAVGRELVPCEKCVLFKTTSEPVDEFLYAKESVRLYYTGYTQNADGYVINLRIENDSDYTISGYIGPDAQVGNKKANMRLSFKAEPGRTAEGTITITNENLEKAGITDFKTIRASITIFDAKNNDKKLDFSTGFLIIRLKD